MSIPEHPSGNSADTCLLPPYPHCPGPLLELEPPPVNRPAMSFRLLTRQPTAGSHLPSSPVCRGPQLQPVPHKINITAWRNRSHLFHDPSLVDMLEFGFPVGYTAPHPPASYSGNHSSANQYLADVSAYIAKELEHSAVIGPADHHPFQWTQSHDDQAEGRLIYPLGDCGPLHAPGHQLQFWHPQEFPRQSAVQVEATQPSHTGQQDSGIWVRLSLLQSGPEQGLPATPDRPLGLALPHVAVGRPTLCGHFHPLRSLTRSLSLPKPVPILPLHRRHHRSSPASISLDPLPASPRPDHPAGLGRSSRQV